MPTKSKKRGAKGEALRAKRESLHTAVADSLEEFYKMVKEGNAHGWRSPGPAQWDLWTVFDILERMTPEPESPKERAIIENLGTAIADHMIDTFRQKEPLRKAGLKALTMMADCIKKELKY
jgi:hypothetical protein